jgi:hypothetical protein
MARSKKDGCMRRSTPTGLPSPPHGQSVQPARMCDARAPQDSPTPWQNFCWLKSRLVLSPVLRLPEEEEYLYGPYDDRFCSTPSRRGAATTPLFCGPCCHGYTFAQTHFHNSVFILIRDTQQLCYTTVPPPRQCRDATHAGELSGVWLRHKWYKTRACIKLAQIKHKSCFISQSLCILGVASYCLPDIILIVAAVQKRRRTK